MQSSSGIAGNLPSGISGNLQRNTQAGTRRFHCALCDGGLHNINRLDLQVLLISGLTIVVPCLTICAC